MDALQKQLLAEDIAKNEWFLEVFRQHKEGLESIISSASLSNKEEVIEAAVRLRELKRFYAELLSPLDINIT